jgi:hypothetical protein
VGTAGVSYSSESITGGARPRRRRSRAGGELGHAGLGELGHAGSGELDHVDACAFDAAPAGLAGEPARDGAELVVADLMAHAIVVAHDGDGLGLDLCEEHPDRGGAWEDLRDTDGGSGPVRDSDSLGSHLLPWHAALPAGPAWPLRPVPFPP